MSYAHNPFPYAPYEQPVPVSVPLEQPVDGLGIPQPAHHHQHPTQFMQPINHHHHHPAAGAFPYHPNEYHELYFHAMDDYDEYAENLTRPRLTKEQVDTLEAQFQAHPKPNSDTKRQLAMQTNLTLPRVANWFQNRRAKAKQLKRQEEFERSQALDKSDESGDGSGSSQADNPANEGKQEQQAQELTNNNTNSSTTPTQERPDTSKAQDPPAAPAQPQQNASPNKTASDTEASEPGQQEAKPNTTSTGGYDDNTAQRSVATGQNDAAIPPQSQVDLAYGIASNQHSNPELLGVGMDAVTSAMWGAPLQAPDQLSSIQESVSHPPALSADPNLELQAAEMWPPMQGPNGHFVPVGAHPSQHDHGPIEWNQMAMNGATLPDHTSFPEHCSAPLPVSNSPALADQRRGSCTSEHGGLTTGSVPQSTSQTATPALAPETVSESTGPTSSAPSSQDLSLMSRQLDSRIDLAARRKRPRPAAIGTTPFNRSRVGPSSMSPTTRLPNSAGHHSLRHAKSTQNIGSSLSPRYPGIRKSSAALRSPLGFGNAMESSLSGLPSSGLPSSDSTAPSLVSTTMAPPTPLTPEELQYLLPQTPNDSQYCVSPSQDASCHGWFSTSQSMPLHVHSPPTTPLHPSVMAHMQYHTMQGPPSAPPHQAAFEPYTIPEVPGSAEGCMWPVGEIPKHMQEQPIQMPQPVHVPSVLHGAAGLAEADLHIPDSLTVNGTTHTSSPRSTGNSKTPTNISNDDATPPSFNASNFFHQQLSLPQEAHTVAPQPLPPQNHQAYAYAN